MKIGREAFATNLRKANFESARAVHHGYCELGYNKQHKYNSINMLADGASAFCAVAIWV